MAFRGKVKGDESGGYKLVLDRGALGSSCRFTRRFGSKYFIRVKVDKSLYYDPNNRLSDFFQHRFVLWGHVFRACYAKDDNVFLIKVNETMLADGSIAKTQGPSLEDFINWFNPLDKNQKQASFLDIFPTGDMRVLIHPPAHVKMGSKVRAGFFKLGTWAANISCRDPS